MAENNLTEHELRGTAATTEEKIHEHRLWAFTDMGFNEFQAEILAVAPGHNLRLIDTYYVRRIMEGMRNSGMSTEDAACMCIKILV